jgi:uncharacterized protein YjbI with pentapeptide repeats
MGVVVLLALAMLSVMPVAAVSAACTVEREAAGEPALFVRHFSPDCSKVERASQAVPAAEILAALKAGQGLSITNAVITGDLLLTQLSLTPLAALAVPERVLATLGQARVTEARVIGGPFQIRNSVVDGIVDTQLKPDMTEHRLLGDMVVIQGAVSFKGTTFVKNVDFSRTVFLGPVDSSDAVFLGDVFFLSCIFDQPATFEKTAFSGNTRFYQALFHEPVTFLRVGFSGLTNFLSVTFKKEAGFSRAYFKMGTGFSGSKFEGISDFSESVFEKAAFFTHALFAADAYFRRATFRGEANFSDAGFQGKDDFAKVFYKEEPNFTRAKFAAPRSAAGLENPVFLAIVGVALAVFLIAFIVMLKKG